MEGGLFSPRACCPPQTPRMPWLCRALYGADSEMHVLFLTLFAILGGITSILGYSRELFLAGPGEWAGPEMDSTAMLQTSL